MDSFAAHKNTVYNQIAQQILTANQNAELSYADTKEVSDYVIGGMRDVKDQDSLIRFLEGLSKNWFMFKELLSAESGKVQKQQEKQTAEEVADLIESGQANKAVNIAQKAMDQDG